MATILLGMRVCTGFSGRPVVVQWGYLPLFPDGFLGSRGGYEWWGALCA